MNEARDRGTTEIESCGTNWPLGTHETVQNPGVLHRPPKRTAGPALGDGMVPVERSVHDRGSHLQHQMGTPRRPAHLLLSVHSEVQQPLNRALGDRRRDRFLASANCCVIDNDIGLSRYVRLKVAQKTRHLLRDRGKRHAATAFSSAGGINGQDERRWSTGLACRCAGPHR